jgi:hypothetical protein
MEADGSTVYGSLIAGYDGESFAVAQVPEPSSFVFLAVAASLFFFRRNLHRDRLNWRRVG